MALSKVSTNQIDTAATPTVAEATVTGDLTVDTNTLHVDAANNRVGVGTTSPGVGLEVTDSVCVGRQTAAAQSKFVGIGGSGGTFVTGTTGGGYTEYEVKSDQDTLIHFITNDQGNSHARRVSVLPTGGLTFNGDTATANALDDYEQGSWTPVAGGTSTSGTFAGTNQVGKYTKIGNLVNVWFDCDGTISGAAGSFAINGLPYSNANATEPVGTLMFNLLNTDGNDKQLCLFIGAGHNYIRIFQSSDNAQWSLLSVSNEQIAIRGQITYMTSG